MCLLVIGKQGEGEEDGLKTATATAGTAAAAAIGNCDPTEATHMLPAIGCGMQTAASREPVFAPAPASRRVLKRFLTFSLTLKSIYLENCNGI